MSRKLAVLDVDRTLYDGSLTRDIFRELARGNVWPFDIYHRFLHIVRQFKRGEISYTEQVNQVLQLFLNNIKGVHYGDVMDIAKDVAAEALQHQFEYPRELACEYKKKEFFLLAISQSPKFVVDLFTQELGFDKSYGAVFEIGPSGKFTGEVTDEHLLFNKGAIVKRVVQKENLTLAGSMGIGDADSDISFLELVGRPICFNPTSVLRREAKRMGWKIVVERSGVVYDIQ